MLSDGIEQIYELLRDIKCKKNWEIWISKFGPHW